jgi:SNF2 family DNA or RNA helicase
MSTDSSPLRASQRGGVTWLLSHPEALLLWPVATGKTRTTLEAVDRISLVEGGRWLIVATRRIACDGRVWEAEAARWGIDLTFALVHGSARLRANACALDVDCYVTTYDSLHTPEVQALLPTIDNIIFDELSYLKSYSRRFKKVRKHLARMKRRWGLTATPSTEHLSDLFYVVQALDLGKRFGMLKEAFMDRYFRAVDFAGYIWKPRQGAEAQLFAALDGLAHRVTYADLPPVVTRLIEIPLDDAQRAPYRVLERDLIAMVGDRELVVGSTAVLANKLRQLCSGFVYLDGGRIQVSDNRLTAISTLLDDIEGEPLMIVYEFKTDRDAILARYPGMITLDDHDAVGRWNRREVQGLVMHARSGGHGLNLQFGGFNVLWFTLPWSAELLIQVRGRLARPGQASARVIEHVFIAPDTIETEKVWPQLLRKLDEEQRLLDHVSSMTPVV